MLVKEINLLLELVPEEGKPKPIQWKYLAERALADSPTMERVTALQELLTRIQDGEAEVDGASIGLPEYQIRKGNGNVQV